MPAGNLNENPLAEGLMSVKRAEPCVVVIFGATGDLTARKLLPALFNLNEQGFLPPRCAIIGVGRRPKTDDEFRGEMRDAVAEFSRVKPASDGDWENFGQRVFYQTLDFASAEDFPKLLARIEEVERERTIPPNRLFYLATKPEQFDQLLEDLNRHKLVLPPGESPGWQRVVIEKPFGRDLPSARALNHKVASCLNESQAYRIDHFLGKETVQNLISFRFANAIFEPLWNHRHVEWIQITTAETVGMESGRGGYYDTAGAMRDMIQNHLMQLLCLVAMEPPSRMDADSIRNEKVKVLRTLRPLAPEEARASVVRGQYGEGSVFGKKVPAYRQEDGVAPDSTTETYVAIRLELDNWRWAATPFYLRTGKRLPKRVTEIAIRFRLPPVGLFEQDRARTNDGGRRWISPNMLLLRIQPDEGISLSFDAKAPGMRMKLQPVRMDFQYGASFNEPSPEAYERLLLDALIGDASLFTRDDEVEASWEFVTSIQNAWAEEPPPALPNYEAGSWGPADADRLFPGGEGHWRRL